MESKIFIIGYGNTLLQDEGIGIHLLNRLQQNNYPPEIKILDGGTSSWDLITLMEEADFIIIIDAMKGGGKPGAVYTLTSDELVHNINCGLSLHQMDIPQNLALASQLGSLKPVLLIGIEPDEITPSLNLSSRLQKKLPKIIKTVEEIIQETLKVYA